MCLVLENFFYTNQIIKGSNYKKWIIIYCWKITFLEILPSLEANQFLSQNLINML